jgi:hypothetical protein
VSLLQVLDCEVDCWCEKKAPENNLTNGFTRANWLCCQLLKQGVARLVERFIREGGLASCEQVVKTVSMDSPLPSFALASRSASILLTLCQSFSFLSVLLVPHASHLMPADDHDSSSSGHTKINT